MVSETNTSQGGTTTTPILGISLSRIILPPSIRMAITNLIIIVEYMGKVATRALNAARHTPTTSGLPLSTIVWVEATKDVGIDWLGPEKYMHVIN